MSPKGWRKRKSPEAQTTPVAKRASLTNSSGFSTRLVEKAKAVSRPELVELFFEFIIPDFSLLTQKNGEAVYSPSFHSKCHENIKWKLKIQPDGRTEETKGYLGIFLYNKSVRENAILTVTATHKFAVFKNGENKVSKKGTYNKFTSCDPSWGWEKLVSLDQLKSEGNQETEIKLVCHLVF